MGTNVLVESNTQKLTYACMRNAHVHVANLFWRANNVQICSEKCCNTGCGHIENT
jgi:hypothetical protein